MEAGQLWKEEVQSLHDKDYKDVELSHMLADNCAMQLVRNPKQLIASFAQVINNPSMQDIGLKKSWELFNKIENQKPVVLDSAQILKNPKALLSKLCDKLEIPFYEEMLSWPAGGIKEDGAWAEYWYKNVHSSTGFAKQKTSSRELPKHCESLYLDALKYYDKLKTNSISV